MKFVASTFRNYLAAALVFATTLSVAAEPVRYESRPGSKIKIEGTSTIHDWTVESSIIGGFMEIDSSVPLDPANPPAELKATPKVEVMVPVRSLKSGKKLMDDVMHDAMNVKEHARITYVLKDMKPKGAPAAGQPLQFDTKGDLTVSGVKKEIDMVVTLQPMQSNQIKALGTKQLKMSDFGIKPPAPAVGLGLIKTADEVTVSFEWITARKEAKTASAN